MSFLSHSFQKVVSLRSISWVRIAGWTFVLIFLLNLSVSPKEGTEINGVGAEESLSPQGQRKTNIFQSLVEVPLTPKPKQEYADPQPISAKSALVTDLKTGTILWEKEAHLSLPPASTTKMMTALVSLDSFSLEAAVTVPEICSALPVDQSQMGLVAGERLSVENLLYGLLVQSASDAACTLSYHHPQGQEGFINEMNTKAASLGMGDSIFANPSGNDTNDSSHLASAWDLNLAAKKVLDQSVLRKIVGTQEVNIPSLDQKYWHLLRNTNELLFTYPGTVGVKTGFTGQALGCLILAVERQGHELLIVVLGSVDRFGEAQMLADWALGSYTWD